MDDIPDYFADLVSFLQPTSLLNLRRGALEIVASVSAALDGTAGIFFRRNDFALAKALCTLCEVTASDRTQTFAALTNFASGSAEAAEFILSHSKCVEIAYTAVVTNAVYSSVASRLLANISRHFPDRTDVKLKARNADYVFALLDEIRKCVAAGDEDRAKFIGFIIVNLTILPSVRELIAAKNQGENNSKNNKPLLPIVCDLLSTAKSVEIRECAADVLRNLAFDDGLHEVLLNPSDEYLCAVLGPLLDVNDELDDDEMAKLPIRLQYYEKTRETSELVRQKLIEALFQLCATTHGRQTLRAKGVYPAMRELDKSGEALDGPKTEEAKRAKTLLSSQQEHTLHALIGILIRYESEMDVDPTLDSIRQLGTTE